MDPYRAIADCTYDWESWMSDAGEVLWTNPAVERMTGYSVEECKAMSDYPLAMVAAEDRHIVHGVLAAARQGHSGNHIEFRLKRKDGALAWGAISFRPMEGTEGNCIGFRTSVRDVTERKILEAELRDAKVRAEDANLAKTRFLANVSHELRTPLQSVVALADLLESHDQATSEIASLARSIATQGALFERLVGDLIDYSSLESEQLPLLQRPCDVKSLLESSLAALQLLAKDKGCTLTWQIRRTAPLMSDGQRIAQVLSNLVGNALKFAAPGPILVTETSREGYFSFAVEDAGPGIEIGERAFEPFVQGGALDTSDKTYGVGLGLSICHQLTQRLGGGLRYSKSRFGGACLEASFADEPMRASAHDSAMPPFGSPGQVPHVAPRRCSVLVVDDHEPTRLALVGLVESLGHEAVSAEDSASALRAVIERASTKQGSMGRKLDLALVDLHMPDGGGIELARRIRRAATESLKIVAISAGSRRPADDSPFDDFVPKPLRRVDLGRLLGALPAGPAPRPTLDPDRLAELMEIGARGLSLWSRLERPIRASLLDLSDRIDRLSTTQRHHELVPLVHEISGICALVGANQLHLRSRELEEGLRLVATPVPCAIETMADLVAALKSSLENEAYRTRGP